MDEKKRTENQVSRVIVIYGRGYINARLWGEKSVLKFTRSNERV